MRKYTLPQVSYWAAYRVIPRYAFQAFDHLVKMWTQIPTATAPFYYLKACQEGCVNPIPEDARLYSTEFGALGTAHDYYLMTYPVPAPIDFSDLDIESFIKLSTTDIETLMEGGMLPVLAPHFSVVVRRRGSTKVYYFVLGQAPMGGGTTLRTVTAREGNANLGPGPEPIKQLFLDRVLQVLDATN